MTLPQQHIRINLLGEGKRRRTRIGGGGIVTLDSAVSRILSPVVDIATEERVNHLIRIY